jgi:hypothetical protein
MGGAEGKVMMAYSFIFVMRFLLSFATDWHEHWKAMVASSVAAFTMLADFATEAKGWEDVSLKVLLLGAVVFLVRHVLKQQAEHKADSAAREQRMLEAINRAAEGMEKLTDLTKEQTDYYKAVTRNIVAERLKVNPTLPG